MKQNYTHLYADGVHSRKQLHNLLEAAGFTVTEDTFRNLEMKENGKYADVTFRITDGNGLTGLSERDAIESVFDGVFQRLANVLGQRFLSDIEVTDKNPLTEGSQKGIAYVKARIAGIPMATKEFGGQLYNSYVQGIMTEKDIASRLYFPDMLKMHNELHREALYAAVGKKQTGTGPSDADIHDELDETIRQAKQAEERIIEVDMDMTPQQLKDVLAKEGIQLLDILPGIDEPLPLNKQGGNVAHVYLRVDCDCNSVIDWADEYMYRDARAEDSDTRITKLSQIVNSQEQLADKDIDTLDEGATLVNAEEKEVPWYEDLTRISEVKIFRNPFLHDRDEYRMKCRIDGVQQLGRVLFPTQVVELANGADKTEIAAQVFAREMTLNNPNDQSIKAGPGR